MWYYTQSNGHLTHGDPSDTPVLGIGYSGTDAGKNNPVMENVPNVGPIPCGMYSIGEPYDSPQHGPFALPLIPFTSNRMYGRTGFLLHGDSKEHPGCASQGCIIMSRDVRQRVWNSQDYNLIVLSGFDEAPIQRGWTPVSSPPQSPPTASSSTPPDAPPSELALAAHSRQ